jgi:thymidylate synthase (FAD)
MQVRLVAITSPVLLELSKMTPEEYIVYIARISNPSNQLNIDTAPKLINYCVNHGHWSIFDQVDFTVEIETTRGIAPQILRHWSARFQEFSLRYAEAMGYEEPEMRYQGERNRQGGEKVVDESEITKEVKDFVDSAFEFYEKLLAKGVSKESARFILPLCTKTKLYMKNTVRSWLTYMNQRLHKDTQKEHRLICEEIKKIFIKEFPVISESFNNFQNAFNEKFM